MLFEPHSDKQEAALFSDSRITLVATGIQYGKTTIGAVRMKLAMHTFTDPLDNFLITAPTYKIMKQSSLPAFLSIMAGYGTYNKSDACFHMHNGGTCWMRTATDPDSVVGIPRVRHVWCDEAGLYTLYFWENIQARAASKQAPIDLTTSPYSLNWVYKELIKGSLAGKRSDILYIKARSDENPYFPKEEFERRKATMDERRFRMVFGGEFEKMEGLVYDCFDEKIHIVEPFDLPKDTVYYGGIDWGYTDPFVLVVHAVLPNGHRFQVAERYKTKLTIKEIGAFCKDAMEHWGVERFYADPSQPGSIEFLNRMGVPTVAANNDIRVGIDTVYELMKAGMFKIFKDSSPHTLDELSIYHYPDPKDLKPDQHGGESKPVDQNNHCCDALKYVCIMTHRNYAKISPKVPGNKKIRTEKDKIEVLMKLPKRVV